MLAADSSRARLDMMSVELGCSRPMVDVSWSYALRVKSGGAGGASSGDDLDGGVTANHLSGGTASGVGSDSNASGDDSGGVVPRTDSDGTTSTGGGARVQDQAGKVHSLRPGQVRAQTAAGAHGQADVDHNNNRS